MHKLLLTCVNLEVLSLQFTENRPNLAEELQKEEVRVIRQEAVGMYEVAVLEAGSAAALKKWIDEHG